MLENSTSVQLLTEHHFEILSLNGAAQAPLSLHLSKSHIVGNHMSRLNYVKTNGSEIIYYFTLTFLFILNYDFIMPLLFPSNRNCLGQFRRIPWNQTSDVYRGSTLKTCTLTLHIMRLIPKKPCQHNNKCDCSKTNGCKRRLCFFNKISVEQYLFEKSYIHFCC